MNGDKQSPFFLIAPLRDHEWEAELRRLEEQQEAEQKRQQEQREWWAGEWARRAQAVKDAREQRIKNRLGLVKERRSRIDWSNLIDNDLLVDRQVMWERNHTVIAMREAGLKFREIGERMGVTGGRAQQMYNKARRTKGPSPVENYLNHEWQPIAFMAEHGKPVRRRMHKTLSVFTANLFWQNGDLDGRI